jgi:hypothetical protein
MEGVLVYDTDGILVWEETSGQSITFIYKGHSRKCLKFIKFSFKHS